MIEMEHQDYRIIIFQGRNDLNSQDSNVDVEVVFESGERYTATFFTLENVKRLMKSYEQTGECSYGQYFWAADLVLVQELSHEKIVQTVEAMIANHELKTAFSLSSE